MRSKDPVPSPPVFDGHAKACIGLGLEIVGQQARNHGAHIAAKGNVRGAFLQVHDAATPAG
jgi:hypothetical protein